MSAVPQQAQPFQPQFTQVPNVLLSASPSAVVFRKVLYVLMQQSGDAGWLWYTTSSNGQRWSNGQQVANVGVTQCPAGVVFRDKLYVLHQQRGKNGELRYTTFNGSAWTPDQLIHSNMSWSPAAVVFRDRLYAFYQGRGDNGQLWYTSFDGTTWAPDRQVPNVGITDSPSAVVYRDRLYVFNQGAGRSGQLWYSTFDGSTWSGGQRINNAALTSSPGAMVYFDGRLYVFHQQSGENRNLYYTAYDGSTWISDQAITGGRLYGSPSAVDFNGNLQVYYQDSAKNGKLWQCFFDQAEIVRVDYDLNNGKLTDLVLSDIVTQTITNKTDAPQGSEFRVNEKTGQTSYFENSITKGISLEIGRNFEASIPEVGSVGGDIKLGLSRSTTWTYGQTESFEKGYEQVFPVTAPPHSKVVCTASVSKGNLEVPYKMILRAKNGVEAPSEGIWTGVTSWDLQSHFEQFPLDANV